MGGGFRGVLSSDNSLGYAAVGLSLELLLELLLSFNLHGLTFLLDLGLWLGSRNWPQYLLLNPPPGLNTHPLLLTLFVVVTLHRVGGDTTGSLHISHESLHVKCELNGIRSWSCTKIVHPGLESLFPSEEVHSAELLVGWPGDMNVQTLRLIDIRSPGPRELDNLLLRNLPDRLVEPLDVRGYLWDSLD